MLDIAKDIRSLTDFKRDTTTALEHVRSSGRPLVLTVNGKAEVVVLAPASYQKLLDLADRMEALIAIEQSLEDVRAGRTKPLKAVLRNLGKQHGLRR
jgi:prevent-host-death family protein